MRTRWKNLVTSNLGTKMVSFLIALLLWAYVLRSSEVEIKKEALLQIITAKNLAPANEILDSISYSLKVPKAFLKVVQSREEPKVVINLENQKVPGVITYRMSSDMISVPFGVKAVSVYPEKLKFNLEYVAKKEVKVSPEIVGASPEGYRLTKVTSKPELISVHGARSRIRNLTEIATTPIDITAIKQSTERKVPLDLLRYEGIQYEGPNPTILLEIEPISANFKIKNVPLRVLSRLKSKTRFNVVTVYIRAAKTDLEQLDQSKVFAEVDLRGKDAGLYTGAVKVTVPEGVGVVRVEPDSVPVTLY